ncbi:carboxypeptidase B-like [Trichoplusia ni]|uniref:Carboxypeptidase B-like n=1 Tax=Trichoplusia ni TaxID=7111 RepID=A0A7E5WPK0_TRINI|nr:carboxypeptidase B-like [Trichoplusia ni]
MARFIFVMGLFCLICQARASGNDTYDNHTLIRLYPTSDDNLQAASHFEDPSGEVEVLKESRGLNDTLDLLVPPQKLQFVEDYAKIKNLKLEVKQPNYGRTLEDVAERTPRRRLLKSFNIYEYNSYANMLEFMETVARRFPDLVTLQNLGKSYEGRKMNLVKISSNPNAGNPIIFVDGGIHGREWVAPAMALYLIHRLSSEPANRRSGGELDGVDWYILPLVNPDGYEYTRSSKSNRMWRKTRSKHTENDCYGVDGNRNYGFKWGVSGISHDPCHKETFAGPRPFSEPETQMVRNVMMDNKKNMKLYVSLHSYGQYLVYPWGYTGEILPKEWKRLDNMARVVSQAVVKAGGLPFKVMSAGKWYPAAGGSDDFAFGGAGIPYSYTMELTDGYEFTFPESRLRNTLPTFYEGFKSFGSQIKKEFGHQRKKRELAQGY